MDVPTGDQVPSAATSTASPLFTRLCTPELIEEALGNPKDVSWLGASSLAKALDQAWRDYYRLLKERNAVYDELNKALGPHAPEAWDRIKKAVGS